MWEPLGEGATGLVYRALDLELRRPVAVKVLKEIVSLHATARERFAREAHAAARLSHPNVVAVFDLGEEDGRHYVVMELVAGGRSLRQRLAEPPDLRALADFLAKVADGVQHANENGIVHRDLKPENILVTEAGEPKVTDFGLAHLLHSSSALTRTGAALGTPAYMAPEQAGGRRHQITERTDVYALGAILYEILVGHPPHTGDTPGEVGAKILVEEPVPPRRLRKDVPAELEAIALKALEKDPARRYASARALADDLRRFLRGEPLAARPMSPARRLSRKIRRHPGAVFGGAAAVAALVMAIGLLRASRDDRTEALALIRETANAAVEDALQLRRMGTREGLRRLLPRLEAAYKRALTRAPELAEVEYLMGRMHRALMDDGKALKFQERALAKDPTYGPALYERVVLKSRRYGAERLKTADLSRVLDSPPRTAEEVPKRPPPSQEELEATSPFLRQLRGEIVRDLDALEALQSRSGIGKANLLAAWGLMAYHEDRFDDARRALEQAVAQDNQMEEAWQMLAESMIHLGRRSPGREEKFAWFRRAEKTYGQAMALDRGYLPYIYLRGVAREWQAWSLFLLRENAIPDYDACIRYYSQAIAADPTFAVAWMRRGSSRFHRGDQRRDRLGEDPLDEWNLGEKELGEAVRLDPNNVTSWSWRARLRHWRAQYLWTAKHQDPLPDWAGAEDDCSQALKVRSDEVPIVSFPTVRSWRARIRINRGLYRWREQKLDPEPDWRAAQEDLAEALRLAPSNAEAWQQRGVLHLQRGVRRASSGNDPLAEWALADKDLTEALRLRDAPDIAADRAEVYWARAEFLGTGRDYAAAVKDWEHTMTLDAIQKPRLSPRVEAAQQRQAKVAR